MRIKFLLFAFSFFAVLSLSSQNANADCTYGGVPSGLQDQENFFDCIKVSYSFCDGSCGAFNDGCEGTKAKVKVITQCYSAPLLSACRTPVMFGGSGGDHLQAGVRYTYKDCATDPVFKQCYAGACVQCLSNADCTLPKICDLNKHECVSPPKPTCPNPTGLREFDCKNSGCAWCAPPLFRILRSLVFRLHFSLHIQGGQHEMEPRAVQGFLRYGRMQERL